MGLQGVDTTQLWAQGCGQEALSVQLGPRHLSVLITGWPYVCRKLEPAAVPRPSWEAEAASSLLGKH